MAYLLSPGAMDRRRSARGGWHDYGRSVTDRWRAAMRQDQGARVKQTWRRLHRQDLARGRLNSEQRFERDGAPPSTAQLALLPARFEREHFASVERSVFGLLRCERDGERVTCRLLNRWPALTFVDERIDSSDVGVVRCWRIAGGGLAQRNQRHDGTLALGLTIAPLPSGEVRLILWSRVEEFPSLFLTPCRVPVARLFWEMLGRIYAAYHAFVAFQYLARMARFLDAPPPEESHP